MLKIRFFRYFVLLCNCGSFTSVIDVMPHSMKYYFLTVLHKKWFGGVSHLHYAIKSGAVFNLWVLQWYDVINIQLKYRCFTLAPSSNPSKQQRQRCTYHSCIVIQVKRAEIKKHHTRRVQHGQAGSELHRLCLAAALLHPSVLSLHKDLARKQDERQIQKSLLKKKEKKEKQNCKMHWLEQRQHYRSGKMLPLPATDTEAISEWFKCFNMLNKTTHCAKSSLLRS